MRLLFSYFAQQNLVFLRYFHLLSLLVSAMVPQPSGRFILLVVSPHNIHYFLQQQPVVLFNLRVPILEDADSLQVWNPILGRLNSYLRTHLQEPAFPIQHFLLLHHADMGLFPMHFNYYTVTNVLLGEL